MSIDMATKLDDLLERLPAKRRIAIQARADKLATLKDLSHALPKTRQDRATLTTSQHSTPRHRIK